MIFIQYLNSIAKQKYYTNHDDYNEKFHIFHTKTKYVCARVLLPQNEGIYELNLCYGLDLPPPPPPPSPSPLPPINSLFFFPISWIKQDR